MAGFMIAAPRSGSGKTMVTCGILELLKRKQKNPFSYKCGPDYIDGLFHRKVLGIEGGNLDSFFEQPQDMREKYAAVSETHFPVVEGVMGYFDGLGGDTTAASSGYFRSAGGAGSGCKRSQPFPGGADQGLSGLSGRVPAFSGK